MTEADTTTINEDDGKLVLKGNYGKLEFDSETGKMDARTDGVMIGHFYGLTVYDFILRFAKDLDTGARERAAEFIKEHEDTFLDEDLEYANVFKGDHQSRFRFTGDDWRMMERDIREEVSEFVAPEFIHEDYQEEIAEMIFEDNRYDVDEGEALREALDEVVGQIKDDIKYDGITEVIGRDYMYDVQEQFLYEKGNEVVDVVNNLDIWAEVEEALEEILKDRFAVYDVYFDQDDDVWKLQATDRDRAEATSETKRGLAEDVKADHALVRVRKMNGEVEDVKAVEGKNLVAYLVEMDREDREKLLSFAGFETDSPVIDSTAAANDDSQTQLLEE